jgi:hypothetical protein
MGFKETVDKLADAIGELTKHLKKQSIWHNCFQVLYLVVIVLFGIWNINVTKEKNKLDAVRKAVYQRTDKIMTDEDYPKVSDDIKTSIEEIHSATETVIKVK